MMKQESMSEESVLNDIGRLTATQQRVIRALPSSRFIKKSSLASKLQLSSAYLHVQIKKLEALGYVTVATPMYHTAPMRVKLKTLFGEVLPNFDKLLINTKWAQ